MRANYLENVIFILFTSHIIQNVYSAPIEEMNKKIETMEVLIQNLQIDNRQLKSRLATIPDGDALVNLIADVHEFKTSSLQKRGPAEESTEDGSLNSLHRRSKRQAATRRIRLYRRHKRSKEVGFQVILSPRTQTYSNNEPIKFDRMITNIGNAYDSTTGIFKAPIAGTYLFNLNIVSQKESYVEVSIQLNQRPTVTAVSDHRSSPGMSSGAWDQGSTVAILRLKQGDSVSAVIQWPRGTHAIHGAGKSSFSGYLLRAHRH